MILPSPLLIATRNPGKLREIEAILAAAGAGRARGGAAGKSVAGAQVQSESGGVQAGGGPPRRISLVEFPDYVPPPEDNPDYLGNARLKARDAAARLGLPALADDSGIEVDALGGAPGPRSARFAGEGADDAANNAQLLRDLEGAATRAARYRCAVVLAWPGGREAHAEGACEGTIGFVPRGTGGFGYDPYFLMPGGLTMAELPAEEKNRISHRARALQALLAGLTSGG